MIRPDTSSLPRWNIRVGTQNRKLGPGSTVVTLDARTCPRSCPLRDGGGCYAESGPLAVTWKRVTEGKAKGNGRDRWAGEGFDALASTLRAAADRIPQGSVVRIGDAGDPSFGGVLDVDLLSALVHLRVHRGVRPIIYTHVPLTDSNRLIVERFRRRGVVVNVSRHGDSPPPGPDGLPWVTTIEEDEWTDSGWTESGRVRRCPAETSPTTCADCGLCSIERSYAIGFTPHGSGRKRVAHRSKTWAATT